ncbi:MAG: hypothetical protein ACKVPX_07645 [Myxococcaceae bacterium]
MNAAQVLRQAFLLPANRWSLASVTLASVVHRSTTPLVWAAISELAYLAMSMWDSKKRPT